MKIPDFVYKKYKGVVFTLAKNHSGFNAGLHWDFRRAEWRSVQIRWDYA